MALSIANQTIVEKARRAGHLLGVNETTAVGIALDYYLEHCRFAPETDDIRKEAARLLDELAALPVLDARSPEEILGYDGDGLP